MTESKATNKKLKKEIREFGKRRQKETKKQGTFRLKKNRESIELIHLSTNILFIYKS